MRVSNSPCSLSRLFFCVFCRRLVDVSAPILRWHCFGFFVVLCLFSSVDLKPRSRWLHRREYRKHTHAHTETRTGRQTRASISKETQTHQKNFTQVNECRRDIEVKSFCIALFPVSFLFFRAVLCRSSDLPLLPPLRLPSLFRVCASDRFSFLASFCSRYWPDRPSFFLFHSPWRVSLRILLVLRFSFLPPFFRRGDSERETVYLTSTLLCQPSASSVFSFLSRVGLFFFGYFLRGKNIFSLWRSCPALSLSALVGPPPYLPTPEPPLRALRSSLS